MRSEFEKIEKLENDHERLVILRKRLGKSQYQFAKDIGVSASYLGQVENYKFPFTTLLKKRINEFLRKDKELDDTNIFSDYE